MRCIILIYAALGFCAAGCGGSANKAQANVVSLEDYETSTYTVEAGNSQVEGLLGNVTQDEIERVFSNHRNALIRCYENAIEDLEEIEGELRFQVEVASDGTVNTVFMSESDLGSFETERCMVNLVKGFEFRRVPGGLAVIYYPLILEAPYDHPEFVNWPQSKIDDVVSEHREEVERCLGGRSGVHLTLYIGMGGVVHSAGASAETLEAYSAVECLSNAARSWTFADPGSKIVKARIDL
jgi:hypothetical protein